MQPKVMRALSTVVIVCAWADRTSPPVAMLNIELIRKIHVLISVANVLYARHRRCNRNRHILS